MLFLITGHTVAECTDIGGIRCDWLTKGMSFDVRRLLLVPLLTGFGGRLRCLRTQVDKFEEVIIMWNVQGRLAMALPLECRSCVQFFSSRNKVMNGPRGSCPRDFKACKCCCTASCRRRSSFPVLSLRGHVRLVDLPRPAISILQTLNGFSVVVARL